MEADGVRERPKAQNDVGPALAGGGGVVKLAAAGADLRLLRVPVENAGAGETIEHAELLLAQTLVDEMRRVRRQSTHLIDAAHGGFRPCVWRHEDGGRPRVLREIGEPSSEGLRLADAEG